MTDIELTPAQKASLEHVNANIVHLQEQIRAYKKSLPLLLKPLFPDKLFNDLKKFVKDNQSLMPTADDTKHFTLPSAKIPVEVLRKYIHELEHQLRSSSNALAIAGKFVTIPEKENVSENAHNLVMNNPRLMTRQANAFVHEMKTLLAHYDKEHAAKAGPKKTS
jgi:hypothetical protein